MTLSLDAFSDVMQTSPPHRWSARWIGLPAAPPVDGSIVGLDAGPTARPHEVLNFHRSVFIEGSVRQATLRVAADSRYILWINGVEIARGPARNQPHRMRADVVDVRHSLKGGENTITATVTYFGDANAVWMPALASGGLGTGPAFLAELVVTSDAASGRVETVIVSDESWSVRQDGSSRRLARTDVEGIPAEVIDARAIPTSWAPAAALTVGHLSGAGRATPPADPYGPLADSALSAPEERTRRPVSLRRYAASAIDIHDEDEHPSARVGRRLAHTPAVIDGHVTGSALDTRSLVEFDFGRIVTGLIEMDIEAEAGTEIDLDLREAPLTAVDEVPHGLRYIARGVGDGLRSSDQQGFRYLVVDSSQATARVRDVRVRERAYPRRGPAAFSSSDPVLDAIWKAGIRTVEVNSVDAYTDCPTREQRAWVGDGVVHAEIDLLTNEDRGLVQAYIELAASPRSDGILPMSVAGDVEAAHGTTTIPAWTLHWSWAVHLYALHQGIDETVRSALPVMERALRWFLQYVDDRGTLADVPGWGLVDWSAHYTDGRSSILTGLWVRALRAFASLSEAVDNHGAARWARHACAAAEVGFEDFWDASRGVYLDGVTDGSRRRRAASQLASASAIVSGLAPRDRWDRIAEQISDPRALVQRSWIGHPTLGFDPTVIEQWNAHAPEPTWDVENEIVRAEPFGLTLVHEALGRTGHVDELLASVRTWSTFLQDGYDTFGEGWGWGTHAHGWSSTPTRDLIAFVMGASPREYGGARWRLRPRLAALSRLDATVVTAAGPIRLRVAADRTIVDTAVRVDFEYEGTVVHLQPGVHEF